MFITLIILFVFYSIQFLAAQTFICPYHYIIFIPPLLCISPLSLPPIISFSAAMFFFLTYSAFLLIFQFMCSFYSYHIDEVNHCFLLLLILWQSFHMTPLSPQYSSLSCVVCRPPPFPFSFFNLPISFSSSLCRLLALSLSSHLYFFLINLLSSHISTQSA